MAPTRLRPRYYSLEGRDVRPFEGDVVAWARWFERADRRIAFTDGLQDGACVSTIFLGIDHNFCDGPAIVFESMVFGGEHDGEQLRCATREEAERAHATLVARCAPDLRTRRITLETS